MKCLTSNTVMANLDQLCVLRMIECKSKCSGLNTCPFKLLLEWLWQQSGSTETNQKPVENTLSLSSNF